jgi:hypothetical protein
MRRLVRAGGRHEDELGRRRRDRPALPVAVDPFHHEARGVERRLDRLTRAEAQQADDHEIFAGRGESVVALEPDDLALNADEVVPGLDGA